MRILVILSQLLLWAIVATGQTQPSKEAPLMSIGEDAYNARLRLTIRAVKERYCADERMRVKLLFKFTNFGSQTVILDRFKPIVPQYMVSRTERLATAGQHESHARILTSLSPTEANLQEAQFNFLKVGDSYEVTEDFSFSLLTSRGKELGSGSHVLEVVVLTWYHPGISNVEWRERWKDKGYLWSDPIKSEPMTFVIPKQKALSECP